MAPFDSSAVPVATPPSVEEAVAEGLMLATYASKMALKNRILIEGLTGEKPFARERFIGVARRAVERLSRESSAAAERIAEELREANTAKGAPGHVHDYRSADSDNLEHREEYSRSLAAALQERADDEGFLAELVEQARDDAWREVAQEIEGVLDSTRILYAPDEGYERGRERRIHDFVSQDLALLESRHRFSAARARRRPRPSRD